MPHPKYSSGTDRLRRILGAFYKTVDVMKSSRNSKTNMNIWADDMKAVEDVMLFLEELRDADGVAQAAREPSDEWCDAFLKATGEWIEPHEPETECGVPMECEITQADADEFNTSAREQIRKGYAAALAVPSTPRATTDRNLAESRCEDCPAPRCIVCPVTSTPRGGEA